MGTESDNVANDDQTPTHIALVDGNGEIIETAVLNLQTKQAWWSARRRRKVSWFGHVGRTIKKHVTPVWNKVKGKAAEVSGKVSERLSGAVGLEDLEDSQLDELERESMEDIQLVLMGPNGDALDAQPLKSIFESDSDKTPEDHDDPVIGMLEKASKARNAE